MQKTCTNIRTSDIVPVTNFAPNIGDFHRCQTNRNGIAGFANKGIPPVAVKGVKGVTYEYDPDYLTHVHSVAFTENGKHLTIFEQDKHLNLKVHSYKIDKNGEIKGTHTAKSRNTWLIRDYDYFISADHSLCLLLNSEERAHMRDHRRRRKRGYGSGGKICISLCEFDIDLTMERSPSYNFYPNIYIFNLDRRREVDGYSGFWKFQHGFAFSKSNLICIASQGSVINVVEESLSEEPGKSILFLDFLEIESEPNYKINNLLQRDLSNQILDVCPEFSLSNEPLILFNNTSTKILFIKHKLVYSLSDCKLSMIQTLNSISEPYWVADFEHGEVLFNISQSFFGDNVDVLVEILKQSKGRGDYEAYRKFSIKEILNIDQGCFYCHSICNGTVKLFVEQKVTDRKIIVVDPFEKSILAELSLITKPKDAHVMNVLVNGNEVVVVMRETQLNTDTEFLVIYYVNWRRVCSLKYLASCAALKCYSFNQLKTMNIPKAIESYVALL